VLFFSAFTCKPVGLSVPFVIIWLVGDLFNLIGAVMASLQTTTILIAVYVRLRGLSPWV
jgi:hypothetical protein